MKLTIKSSPLKQLLLSMVLSLVFFSPAYVIAQKTFEGAVTYKVDAQGNGPSSFTYYLKGNMARVDMEMPSQSPMGKAAIIIDGAKNEMIMLITQMKMYMERPLPSIDSTDNGSVKKPVKLGDTQVILGHQCEHYRINQEDGSTVDIWSAKGFGNFMMPGGLGGMSGRGQQQQWMKDLMAHGFFPLKITETDKSGNTEMSMEATKIEERSLSSSLFEVPAGYHQMSLPNMGNMGQQN